MIERILAIVMILGGGIAIAGPRERAAIEMDAANAHLDKREYELAIARFNNARKLAPSSSGPYLGLGLAYAATDRCREAVAYLEEYLRRKKGESKPQASAALADCRARMVKPGKVKIASE